MIRGVAQGVGLGIVLMLAAQVIMPTNDTIAKYLVGIIPAMMVAWARFFFNAVWIVPWVVWRHGRSLWPVPKPKLQILRGLVIVTANICFLMGVRYVPLADALAIVFVAPLAVAAISAKFLDERVTKNQWLAIGVGFIGALIIVRPGFSEISWAALLPLAAGLLFAVYLVLSRTLAASSPPEVTLAYTATTGAIVASVLVPFFWMPPSWPILILMVGVGVISGIGHLCITTAHVYAPASILAPLTYLALVTAAVLGYLVFGEIPDAVTWLGAAIVVASGIALWRFQRRAES